MSTDHETSTTGSTQSSSHDDGNGVPTLTILISKYLSISSFCLSLFTTILTLILLRVWLIKKNQNQSLRNPIYTRSSSNISLDSFDSEGYLRPHTDMTKLCKFFFPVITTVLAAAFILALKIIISQCKKKRQSNVLYPKYYEQFKLQSRDI